MISATTVSGCSRNRSYTERSRFADSPMASVGSDTRPRAVSSATARSGSTAARYDLGTSGHSIPRRGFAARERKSTSAGRNDSARTTNALRELELKRTAGLCLTSSHSGAKS